MNQRELIENALEDFWVGISPELDMNIYFNVDGKLRIIIYPVNSGGITLCQNPVVSCTTEVTFDEGDD